MYLAFYGLKERPFSLLPDPLYLYLSDKHQMAATLLEYAITSQAGFAVITGEIGAGKTTLIRHLLNRLDRRITVGLISNTHASLGGLLRWVLLAFELEGKDEDAAHMYERFVEFLIAQYAKGRRTVLIVDEAQNLPASILEELRMLSNINADKDQVLQTILVGQPGLRETLRRPDLTQFAQRIVVDYHLEPLTPDETAGCIRHRIGVAGGRPELFSDEACAAVYRYSGGSPRLINLICDMSLVYGFAAQAAVITDELVDEVVRDRQRLGALPIFTAPPPEAPAKPRKPAMPPVSAKPKAPPVANAAKETPAPVSGSKDAARSTPAERQAPPAAPVAPMAEPAEKGAPQAMPAPAQAEPMPDTPVEVPAEILPASSSRVVVLAERAPAVAEGYPWSRWLSPGVAFVAGVAFTFSGAVLFLVDRTPIPQAPPVAVDAVSTQDAAAKASAAEARTQARARERAEAEERQRETEARLTATRNETERLRAQAAVEASKATAERMRAEAALTAARAESERLRAEAEAAAVRAEAERRRAEEERQRAAAAAQPPAKAVAEAAAPAAEPAKPPAGETEFQSNPCKGPMAQFLSLCADQK